MQLNTSVRWALSAGIVGVALALVFVFSPADSKLGAPIQSAAIPEKATSGFPVRLKIPVINVDAVVEYVALTAEGTMDVPKSPDDVAWFYPGPRPGEVGSAVIAGHYGWRNGIPAVFDDLSMLQKGDKVYVEDNNGVITTFVVRESRDFNPDADASYVFGSSDKGAHLNLITCEGVWDKTGKSYSKRLVVFTDKE